jgi:peptide deformylase
MSRMPIVMLNEATLWFSEVALRQACKDIDFSDSEQVKKAQSVIIELFRALNADASGVAIAAPQIGVLLNITVIDFREREGNKRHLLALVNPKITPLSDETNDDNEICLSVPNYTGTVARSNSIKVEAYNQHGKFIEFNAEGYFARVIQHEVDHLNGIIYIDRVKGELEIVPDYAERSLGPIMKRLGMEK